MAEHTNKSNPFRMEDDGFIDCKDHVPVFNLMVRLLDKQGNVIRGHRMTDGWWAITDFNIKYRPDVILKWKYLEPQIATTGAQYIGIERQQQILKGRDVAYDLNHNNAGQLAMGAMMLLAEDFEEGIDSASFPDGWDHDLCQKMLSKTYKERLIMAGALIAAELDRLMFTELENGKEANNG